jgi:hypothetical protein
MKRRILIVIIATSILTGLSMAQSNNVSQFEDLKQPRISTKKNQKMLVVEAKGDPNVIGGRAFGLLFQLYYRMPETPKGSMQALPRARWPQALETPKSEWTGLYALPVPEIVSELPQHQAQEGLKASLATWEYGEVGEILHVGPYSREEPTMKRLRNFVKEHGYVILAGGHEEEYVLGPTKEGKRDPEKYVTIIRYRVRKSGEQ